MVTARLNALGPMMRRVRPWLLPGLLLVALGAALALGTVYVAAPVLPMQTVRSVWVDVNGDGAADWTLSINGHVLASDPGWVL